MAGGSERKTILVGLVIALVLGVAVYLRLWTIDYTLSSDDTERLRFSPLFSNPETIMFFIRFSLITVICSNFCFFFCNNMMRCPQLS